MRFGASRLAVGAPRDVGIESVPCAPLGIGGVEAGAGAGAMLVACRLAGLSALDAHYAGVK
jgi:hypothetical protein